MKDIFTFARGRILLDTEDIYCKIFSEARSKTTEHNINERYGKASVPKNETSQKLKKTDEI